MIDLVERAARAVSALREPKYPLGNVPNTIRDSIAEVIEHQQQMVDRYGLALVLIREGYEYPATLARAALGENEP